MDQDEAAGIKKGKIDPNKADKNQVPPVRKSVPTSMSMGHQDCSRVRNRADNQSEHSRQLLTDDKFHYNRVFHFRILD